MTVSLDWRAADMRQRGAFLFDVVRPFAGGWVGVTQGADDVEANHAHLAALPTRAADWSPLLAAARAALAAHGRGPALVTPSPLDGAPTPALVDRGWQVVGRHRWHRVPLAPAPPPPPPAGVTVARVADPDEARAFVAIYREVFCPDPGDRAWVDGVRRSLSARGEVEVVHGLARVDGAPAGVAMLAHDGRLAGLHGLAVRAGFRRRGVGRALVDWRAGWARAAGCAAAFIQTEAASVTGWQARAGVEPVFDTLFWRGPDGDRGDEAA